MQIPIDRRYSAHYALESIGQQGQDRINAARVILVGLGGLGCAAAQYLAGSGLAELHICDFDTVSETNLARQLLYTAEDVGRRKTGAAQRVLKAINPRVRIIGHENRVDAGLLESILPGSDMLVDASDNYGTRLAVNQACLDLGIPWVMGSCIRMEGQLMLFDPARDEMPCYRCVYGKAPDTLEDCPGAGIFAPVAGMIGTGMAHMALAGLAGLELPNVMHLLDARQMNWRQLTVRRNPDCPSCALAKQSAIR